MQAIQLTDTAIDQVKKLIAARDEPPFGIRIGLKTKGCSGLSYTLQYADEKGPFDEEVDMGDFKILIDPKAVMFILGTEMDYVTEDFQSGFVFNNPNEKGKCGCGESFHV